MKITVPMFLVFISLFRIFTVWFILSNLSLMGGFCRGKKRQVKSIVSEEFSRLWKKNGVLHWRKDYSDRGSLLPFTYWQSFIHSCLHVAKCKYFMLSTAVVPASGSFLSALFSIIRILINYIVTLSFIICKKWTFYRFAVWIKWDARALPSRK